MEKSKINKESENVETATDKGVTSTDLLNDSNDKPEDFIVILSFAVLVACFGIGWIIFCLLF